MRRSLLKVGTRGSALALTQTRWVAGKLQSIHSDLKYVEVPIRTSGDRIQTAAALRKAGKGLFVKEIERALLRRKIDCAVHSLKDVPSVLPEGLVLGAVLERIEAADAFIGRGDTPIEKLPAGSVIGTSSLRRQALLKAAWPHLRFEELRGNLDTRLLKLRHPRSNLAGIVVAAAGLHRLYPENPPAHQLISKEILVPAAGQGALAVEIRQKALDVRALLEPLHHGLTAAAVTVERAVLRRLEGGCTVPLGIYAVASDDGLVRVTAALAAEDGSQVIRAEATGSAEDPEGVAAAVETILRGRGADALLEGGLSRARVFRGRPHRNGHASRRRRKARVR